MRQSLVMMCVVCVLACATVADDAVEPTDAPPPPKSDDRNLQRDRGAAPPQEAEQVVEGEVFVEHDIMINGGFDTPNEAEDGPAHWQKVDNLVYHWREDPDAPERGKVILIDTDVNQHQAYTWWIKRYDQGAPLDEAPEKQPTVEPKYDTIGGLDGGFYWSDFIEVEPGAALRVYVDAKGGSSKVFIRGYEEIVPLFFGDESPAVQSMFKKARGEPLVDENGRQIRHFLRYRYTTWFAVGGSAEWRTYTHKMPRHPNNREMTEDVRYIRIMLYPYWPTGQYWYDNIRVMVVQDDDPRGGVPDAEEADYEEGKVVR